MATKKSQRIAIWIIAITLTIGTIGSFLVMALSSQNEQRDQARVQQAYEEYQAAVTKQETELSDKYYPVFKKYEKTPAKFDAKSVKKLTHKDLKVGDGDKIEDGGTFTAYYIGWKPNGEVFDSSFEGKQLKAPYDVMPGGVIEGWTEGMVGSKVGGIRLLTIPADKAYGEQGTDGIPPNTPIKFVVMTIPQPDEVPVPKALEQYYSQY